MNSQTILTQTILAIDTSETACSVALWYQQQLTQRIELTARKHSDCLLPMINSLLSAQQLTLSQLDGLAFACGPGAFTGLRLGAALMQGFSYALALPVMPVSTLLAQAYAGFRQLQVSRVVSALDARMGEVYVGAYAFADAKYRIILPEQVLTPQQVSWPSSAEIHASQSWCGVGSGWCYAQQLNALGEPSVVAPNIHCSAENVLQCVLDLNLPIAASITQHSLPVYLRQRVVG